MKVIVIGSGLIGVTSAYFLRHSGHEVTVIDRAEGPGLETSFANGALLTPSMSDPWNAPGCWRVLLGSLLRSDATLQLRLRALPSLVGWGGTFLSNSRSGRFERNTLSNLRLGLYSLNVMHSLRQHIEIEYGRSAVGSLKIFRDGLSFDRVCADSSRLQSEGMGFRRFSPAEAIKLEPALGPIGNSLAGAIYYESDETGDAYRFCVALTLQARKQGVEFRFDSVVNSLEIRSGRITGVLTDKERVVADCYVMAAGSYSAPLLRQLGIELPVRPVKGYSVTFESQQGEHALMVPIIDDDWHAALVPLNGTVRVAGTAEFAGFDRSIRPESVRNLVNRARRILPRANLNAATAHSWCGLRPMSADGVPIIGSTPISNLWVNTGHGHLGWTMAAGSAQLLAGLMSGQPLSIDPTPFALARFFSMRRLFRHSGFRW